MFTPRLLAIALLFFASCTESNVAPGDAGPLRDGGARDASAALLDAALADAATTDSGPVDGGQADSGLPDAGPTCEAPGFRALIADDGSEAAGEAYRSWRRSTIDDSRGWSNGRSIRTVVNPGEDALPECSGGHFFAGRTALPELIPQGHTVWMRVYHYIPSTFAFGYKYTRHADGDEDAARACGQHADGNAWLKWLVFAPDMGTARIYLMPTVGRRALSRHEDEVRIISEALHRPFDAEIHFPRDRWFSLQMAVRVSSGDDGFIRFWIDGDFQGEVTGPTTREGASLRQWGIGDYWNGVPWTDGEDGRSTFWTDDIIVAADIDGYGAPTGTDAEGRAIIAPCTTAATVR